MMMIPGQPFQQFSPYLYKALPQAMAQAASWGAPLDNLLTPRYTAWGVGNTVFDTPKAAALPWLSAGIPPEDLQLLRLDAPQEVLSLNTFQAGLLAGEGDRILGPVVGFDPPPTVSGLLDGYAQWVTHEQAKAAAAAGQHQVLASALPVVPETLADVYAAQHQLAQGKGVSPDVVASLMRAFEDRHGAYSTNYFLNNLGYSGKQVGPVSGGLPYDRTLLFGARLLNAFGQVDLPSRSVRWSSLSSMAKRPASVQTPASEAVRPLGGQGQSGGMIRPRQLGGGTQLFGVSAS